MREFLSIISFLLPLYQLYSTITMVTSRFSLIALLVVAVVSSIASAGQQTTCKCGDEKDTKFCCNDLGGTYFFDSARCSIRDDGDRISSFEHCCYDGFERF
ncbi:hypothetical protein BDB00DRAFT_845660 [Zychaea mexicana]|uniref:uncharacterized protein n=1 Tax=Zychaea mexicana TaxID=64656 RepID=UPI0022FEF81A|nr:uncharacterized protein BDB00DRAFT_845660 [Zychaea mexicana]KAI9488996.1 hypothetical protein BDB00DRAFT_845660 [Zychaea mexicana]